MHGLQFYPRVQTSTSYIDYPTLKLWMAQIPHLILLTEAKMYSKFMASLDYCGALSMDGTKFVARQSRIVK